MQASDSAGRCLSTHLPVDRELVLDYRPALSKNVNAQQSQTFGYLDSRADSIDSDEGAARDKTE